MAIALAGAGGAQASDIYVATTGKDGNSGASTAVPLRTIAAAANAANPGDTVWLLPGKYTESLIPARSGTQGRPITFKKYGQEPVVIVAPSGGTNQNAIYVNGVTDIVIDGIDANGGMPANSAAFNSFVTINSSTRVTIRNGTYANANGWWGIGLTGNTSYITIEDNSVDMVGLYVSAKTAGGTGEGIYVEQDSPTHVLVQRNHVTHCGHDLISIEGQFNIAQDNYLDNDWTDVQGAPAGYRNAVIFGSNGIFQRNFLTHSGPGPDAHKYAPLLLVEGTNNIVRQNVLANGYYQAFQTQAGPWTPNGGGARIYNNTAVQMGAGAWALNVYPGYKRSNDLFQNNLVLNTRVDAPSRNGANNDIVFWVKSLGLGPTGGAVVAGNLIVTASGKPPIVFSDAVVNTVTLSDPGAEFRSHVFDNPAATPRFAATPVSSATSSATALASYRLARGSPGVDQGVFLTIATSSGNSASLAVKDAAFFSDGFGLIPGDMIKLQGTAQPVQVVHVDYNAKVLTLAQPVAFKAGQGVALNFQGSAPDIGARELDIGAEPAAPPNLQILKR